MKKITLPLLTILLTSFGAFSQITIRTSAIDHTDELETPAFDSLTNFGLQKKAMDYKQFIGQKVFFIPGSRKYKKDYPTMPVYYRLYALKPGVIKKEGKKVPFDSLMSYRNTSNYTSENLERLKKEYNEIEVEETDVYCPKFYFEKSSEFDGKISGRIDTSPDSVEGKYFTILDIQIATRFGYEFMSLESTTSSVDLPTAKVRYTLQNDLNKDVVYWFDSSDSYRKQDPRFSLVAYFVKHKNMHVNKKFVANGIYEKFSDLNTGELIEIKWNEKWICTDLSFSDTGGYPFLEPYYYLKNGTKEIKMKFIGFDYDRFVPEKEFLKKEKEDQESVRKYQAEKLKIRNAAAKKYGAKIGKYISEGEVVVGMTKQMCIESWGSPENINKTIVRRSTHEQWVYGSGRYLYFDNGVLTAIQH